MFYGPRQKKYATIKFNESAWEGKVGGRGGGTAAAAAVKQPRSRLEASNCQVFYYQILELLSLRLTSNICQGQGANRELSASPYPPPPFPALPTSYARP